MEGLFAFSKPCIHFHFLFLKFVAARELSMVFSLMQLAFTHKFSLLFDSIAVDKKSSYQDIYNKAAEFWAELRVELLTLIATYHEDKPASSFCQLWRMYWASHQVLDAIVYSSPY